MYGAASPAPFKLVTLLECMTTVYWVPLNNGVFGVIFSVLPVMVGVNGFVVPLEFLNSIHGFAPNLMFLLKLNFTTVFKATLTALFAGLVLVITGAVDVVNLVTYGDAKPIPFIVVILFVCSITVYWVPAFKRDFGVINSVEPLIVGVNDMAVPGADVSLSSIHGLAPNFIA